MKLSEQTLLSNTHTLLRHCNVEGYCDNSSNNCCCLHSTQSLQALPLLYLPLLCSLTNDSAVFLLWLLLTQEEPDLAQGCERSSVGICNVTNGGGMMNLKMHNKPKHVAEM